MKFKATPNQKLINAILFFANKSKSKDIKRMKLMKLLWLADRIHLNKYGRLILDDSYYAMEHGSIPTNTMDLSKEKQVGKFEVKDCRIKAIANFNPKHFSNIYSILGLL